FAVPRSTSRRKAFPTPFRRKCATSAGRTRCETSPVSSSRKSINSPQPRRTAIRRLHPFAGQSARLLHPVRHLGFVERVALVNIEIPHVLMLGRTRWDGTQRRAAEECHLHVLR